MLFGTNILFQICVYAYAGTITCNNCGNNDATMQQTIFSQFKNNALFHLVIKNFTRHFKPIFLEF